MSMERLSEQDRLALEQVERGDEQSIARLYDRLAGPIFSMAMQVLHNSALAEQVLSDIFLEIWCSPRSFMALEGSLGASMAILARNRAGVLLSYLPTLNASPHTAAALTAAKEALVDSAAGPVHLAPGTVTREQACSAVDKLPAERSLMLEKVLLQGAASAPLIATPSNAASPAMSSDGPGLPGRQPAASADPADAVSEAVARLAGTGLVVIDIASDPAFARRRLHRRDVAQHIEGMNRLASVFVGSPERILNELVAAAVQLSGADSAGISIELPDGTDEHFYHWAATAGQYSGFADAKLPRYPSACGVTLERGRPQRFRVSQRFFDLMGVQAPTVTDGLLLPWQVDDMIGAVSQVDGYGATFTRGNFTRGTIWIMAHGREEAFDSDDCRLMQALASFAATGVRMMQQQKLVVEQAEAAAEAAMAQKIARQIHSPLQGLMHTVVLLGRGGQDSSLFAEQAMGDITRLSDLVNSSLSLPN